LEVRDYENTGWEYLENRGYETATLLLRRGSETAIYGESIK